MLPGCYDRQEVDDFAYVIAIGLDKGKINILRLTLQLAKPTVIGSGGGGEGGGGGGGSDGSEATTTIVVETPSIFSGLNMANNSLSKKLNLAHAKVMVFSKELAQEGIERYINAIPRTREIRPNISIAVSTSSAEDYIKAVQPHLEINPAKYYEMNYQTFKYTGLSINNDFHNFYSQMKSTYQSATAVLAGVNKFNSAEDFSLQSSTYDEKGRPYPLEGDFKAGDMPRESKLKAEIMGLAVFNGSRMVGELDGHETTMHLMVTGEYGHGFITIPDPIRKDYTVVLEVKRSRNPVCSVDISGERPRISVKVILEADIQTIQSGIEYEKPENMKILEKAYEDFLRESIIKYLKRTTEEFKSDICGFGKIAKAKFLTWDEWERYDWLNRYKDAEFNVEVDFKIRRTGLIVSTVPVTLSKEKEAP